MELSDTIERIRNGFEPILPIIDYYADGENEQELIHFLNDADVAVSILFILSELPSIDYATWSAVKELINGGVRGEALTFAKDIVENSKIRR